MPLPTLPAGLKREISAFGAQEKQFAQTAEGRKVLANIEAFKTGLRELPLAQPTLAGIAPDPGKVPGADTVSDWFGRLPDALAVRDDLPLVDFNRMKPSLRAKAIAGSLNTLEAGIMSILAGASPGDDLTADKMIQAAFGNNAASRNTRRPFEAGNGMPKIDLFGAINIEKIVRDGELREAMRLLRRALAAAKSEHDWRKNVRVLGQITSIEPNRACAQDIVTLSFKGLGATPPQLGDGTRLVLHVPRMTGGPANLDVSILDPDMLVPGNWRDSGTARLTLPVAVASGQLQFLLLPPGPGGPSSAALFAQAAGMLGQMFPGWKLATQLNAISLANEQPFFTMVGKGQPGDPDWLFAGPPIIHFFEAKETGPIHPRGYVTLSWAVENAESFDIRAEEIPGSEAKHELPKIPSPLPPMGSLRVALPCSRRWIGAYVLEARNGAPCNDGLARASVTLESGFSHYLVGAGKAAALFDPSANATDHSEAGTPGGLPPAFRMAGFADEKQIATGLDPQSPLFARAFVIAENKARPADGSDAARVAIVSLDAWTCSIAMKTAVLARLSSIYGHGLYTAERVMISATHTHSAPGGFSEYFLYNLSTDGFDRRVFDIFVDAIVAAIRAAHGALAPGRVLVAEGEVPGCGELRSEPAYLANADADPDLAKAVNRSMQLLRLDRHANSFGKLDPIGMINWFAIHPTSLGYLNPIISGDSKGWAAAAFEQEIAKRSGNRRFVAAFANSSAGDISGNVLPGGGASSANIRIGPPMGKRDPATGAMTSQWDSDYARMVGYGARQRDAALGLFDAASEMLTGPIAARATFKDMSAITVGGDPMTRTWPAAIGVSFGAGSPEDSEAVAYLGSLPIPSKIIEGITQTEYDLGGIEASLPSLAVCAAALAALGPLITAGPAALALSAGQLLPVAGAAVGILAALPASRGTSWLFSRLGGVMFGGKVPAPQPSNGGEWRWLSPHELFPENTNPPFAIGGQHGAKPIMFPVGLWQLKHRKAGTDDWGAPINCPLVPHVLPLQIMRIGQFALVGVPAEFTTMAGRRLQQTLAERTGAAGVTRIAIANYTNGYAGYVTTREEYDMQHYEGASTLFGPHTLEAYRQEFASLASALANDQPVPPGAPFVVPAVRFRPGCG